MLNIWGEKMIEMCYFFSQSGVLQCTCTVGAIKLYICMYTIGDLKCMSTVGDLHFYSLSKIQTNTVGTLQHRFA